MRSVKTLLSFRPGRAGYRPAAARPELDTCIFPKQAIRIRRGSQDPQSSKLMGRNTNRAPLRTLALATAALALLSAWDVTGVSAEELVVTTFTPSDDTYLRVGSRSKTAKGGRRVLQVGKARGVSEVRSVENSDRCHREGGVASTLLRWAEESH